MANPKKKLNQKSSAQVGFEEIDHRLACGWHVEVEGSGQRKRYLKLVKKLSSQQEDKQALNANSV